MAAKRVVSLLLRLVLVWMTSVRGQFQQYAPGARVNYYQQPSPVPTQMMVMQIQQTTTVTYIAAPLSSPLSQFVLNNPQGLVYASQRANQRMQNLALEALSFKRMGLDSLGSESTCGRHTIFIGTKRAAMELMEDKTLVDFLLEEIFMAMGFSKEQQANAMRDIIVYNNQGFANRNAPPQASARFTTTTTTTTTPAPSGRSDMPLSCQNSLTLDCDPRARFRSADGTCNNLQHNLWGSSLIPMRRNLAPVYDDGVSEPRTRGRSGAPLTSARDISNMLHHSGPDGHMTSLTHMVMQWGQFIDHDLTSTPVQTAHDGSALTCCEDEAPTNARFVVDYNNRTSCFPIPISPRDPFFRGRTCFSFPRSVQVTNTQCQQEPVEQLNQLTAYIDASMVYGNTEEEQRELRAFRRGELRTSSRDLLPKDTEETCVVHDPATDYCFKAGDIRVNEQMALASMHTVWLRAHNRLVEQLALINPRWDDERLFQEARKIVGALLQQITYGEWLPIVLDPARMRRFNLNLLGRGQQGSRYEPTVDASIKNVFATAAFRFGHSLIRDTMSQLTHNYMDAGSWRLEQIFGNTSQILSSQGLGVDMYMRGLVRDPPNMVDRFFTAEVRNHLFQDGTGNSLDLIAFNIQRGRDHGLPPYNAWRRYCGLRPVTSFSNMPDHDFRAGQAFSQVYQHPDDIDIFSGGISELREGAGLLGPTFACIIAEQFRDLKIGDRFWYETNDPNAGFTPAQLEEIRRHSFARVLCDVTAITQIQPDPFRQVSIGNPLTQCQDLPEMNLMEWREGRGRGFDPQWGMWGKWSQCSQGVQMRSRSCSQGGSVGMCYGDGQQIKECSDRDWTGEWGQWSGWTGCFQGVRRRNRLCQSFNNPCPGSPEESMSCGRDGSPGNTVNPGGSGWSQWGSWNNNCDRGKQWRQRTCSGACIGPGSSSRPCDGRFGNGNRFGNNNFNNNRNRFGNRNGNNGNRFGNGNNNRFGRGKNSRNTYDACAFFNLPEYC